MTPDAIRHLSDELKANRRSRRTAWATLQRLKEGKEEVTDTRTGAIVLRWQEGVSDNHAWDCEYYQTTAAMMIGIDLYSKPQSSLA